MTTLDDSFAALTPDQRSNLRWHAKEGTRILHGKDAVRYSKDGAG